jgi:hypothetical protein
VLRFLERRIEILRAERPVLLSFLVFLVVAGAVVPASLDYWTGSPDFIANLYAEAHGVLMDLLLFGCLLLWFDRKAERQRRLDRYRDELNDFLGWRSDHAKHRLVGTIRRMNREGESPNSLKKAYLHGADLEGADLSGVHLQHADLSEANLRDASLKGAYFGATDLSGADLSGADLSEAHFGAFTGLLSPNAERSTTLAGASLRGANLRGLSDARLDIFCEAATLYKALLDDDLESALEDRCPDVLALDASRHE